jgi:alpha-amylase
MKLRVASFVLLVALVACTTLQPTAPPWNHEWARGAVFYEIFVRSFADSDGDGVGDFNGMTAKLDYLDELGIDGIWLMPMFESTSYHGYDTTDYDNVERDYGTNADFQRFLAEAHKRDIKVIVDLVLNHTGVEHPWFVESAGSPIAPKRDWYVWRATNPGWKQPWGGQYESWHPRNGAWYYGAFWGGMPDVNYRSEEAKAEMFRITRHWLEQGVDGYRLDATRYLIETGPGETGQADTRETHQVLGELSAEVRRVRPEAILVAENTVDLKTMATYFAEMPMNFNFPLATAIVEGVKSGSAANIAATLREVNRLYPRGVIDTPFLTNHDHTRIATVLGNDRGKLRSAAAILLTLPGTPFVYYGEEVGLQNAPATNDEAKRTPMPWTASGGFTTGTPWHAYSPGLAAENVAAQLHDTGSLLTHYRKWIAARKGSAALSKGAITPLETDARILAFVREARGERVLVVHNVSGVVVEATLPVRGRSFELLHGDAGASIDAGHVSLPPHTSAAWRLSPVK